MAQRPRADEAAGSPRASPWRRRSMADGASPEGAGAVTEDARASGPGRHQAPRIAFGRARAVLPDHAAGRLAHLLIPIHMSK